MFCFYFLIIFSQLLGDISLENRLVSNLMLTYSVTLYIFLFVLLYVVFRLEKDATILFLIVRNAGFEEHKDDVCVCKD